MTSAPVQLAFLYAASLEKSSGAGRPAPAAPAPAPNGSVGPPGASTGAGGVRGSLPRGLAKPPTSCVDPNARIRQGSTHSHRPLEKVTWCHPLAEIFLIVASR